MHVFKSVENNMRRGGRVLKKFKEPLRLEGDSLSEKLSKILI